MATIEERYKMIEASVMREATEKADTLTNQKNNFRKNALDKAEDEVLREMYSRIQDEISDIRGHATRTVSREEAKFRQDLLMRREDLTRAVFEQVRARLISYSKTEEYGKFMMNLATEMSKKYPLDNSVVLIRADDYHMASEMDKIFGGKCRIMANEGIRMGGIKLMNQSVGIFVDETLDSRLEDQKPWFYSHSGLTIN